MLLRGRAGLVPVCLAMLVAAAGPATGQQAAGPHGATTVQLPTFGVAIDAEGVLSIKRFEDPTGRLHAERLLAARAGMPADLIARSPLRKVSLRRLEAAIQRRLDRGEKPDDAMRYLAGLQRLRHVFFYPETGDIVIAGPAEGWAADPSGRVRGITTGRPVLELAHLVVALRAFPPGRRGRPFIGCTIDPTPEAMVRLQRFQRTIPRSVPENQRGAVGMQIAEGMRASLGMAPIRLFGVPPDSHFARVLVEADYRMKLIGIGLEPPPVKLASYMGLLGSRSARGGALQRWWFRPNYACVKVTQDRLAMELIGEGVELATEAKLVGPDGQLNSGAPGDRASELFTQGFTRKYPELAAKSPVYAQLRNLVDMVVAAAFIQQQGYPERAGWRMAVFSDEQKLPVRTQPAPRCVAAAANATWKRNRLIALAGGGVSIRANEALVPERLIPDKDGKLGGLRDQIGRQGPEDRWWWD